MGVVAPHSALFHLASAFLCSIIHRAEFLPSDARGLSYTYSYSKSQVKDHKLYHSVYSENPEAFTMSILRSSRYNPNSVYSQARAWARLMTHGTRDQVWTLPGCREGLRGITIHPRSSSPRRTITSNSNSTTRKAPIRRNTLGRAAFHTVRIGAIHWISQIRILRVSPTHMATATLTKLRLPISVNRRRAEETALAIHTRQNKPVVEIQALHRRRIGIQTDRERGLKVMVACSGPREHRIIPVRNLGLGDVTLISGPAEGMFGRKSASFRLMRGTGNKAFTTSRRSDT